MKTRISIIAMFAVVLTLILSSCGTDGDSEHKHHRGNPSHPSHHSK